jgi:hypothetical protein
MEIKNFVVVNCEEVFATDFSDEDIAEIKVVEREKV